MLFTTHVKHLQKLLTKQSEECQHHILTFHLHKTLKSRPHTISWPGVPNIVLHTEILLYVSTQM